MDSKLMILGARVLVKELKNDKETSSGIVLPGAEKEKTNRGTVLAVGKGAILDNGTIVPVPVSVGDTVLFPHFAGFPVKEKESDDDSYLILDQRDILCVVQK